MRSRRADSAACEYARSRAKPARPRKPASTRPVAIVERAASESGRLGSMGIHSSMPCNGNVRAAVHAPTPTASCRGAFLVALVTRNRETVAAAAHGFDRFQTAFRIQFATQAAD